MTTHRDKLGDFSSVVCFKAVIVGVEDTLGVDGAAVVFTRAGKVRGEQLATSLGLVGKNIPIEQLAVTLDTALGTSGTKLCRVEKASRDGDNIVVDTQETVCSAGEPDGSTRKCTFTLGAIWGALETATGNRYLAEHTESVLRGGNSDRFVFRPL
jgi:predicted hydrocarbon binding protein